MWWGVCNEWLSRKLFANISRFDLGKIFFTVKLLSFGSFHFYSGKYKEKTSNNYSASYSMGSCPFSYSYCFSSHKQISNFFHKKTSKTPKYKNINTWKMWTKTYCVRGLKCYFDKKAIHLSCIKKLQFQIQIVWFVWMNEWMNEWMIYLIS